MINTIQIQVLSVTVIGINVLSAVQGQDEQTLSQVLTQLKLVTCVQLYRSITNKVSPDTIL